MTKSVHHNGTFPQTVQNALITIVSFEGLTIWKLIRFASWFACGVGLLLTVFETGPYSDLPMWAAFLLWSAKLFAGSAILVAVAVAGVLVGLSMPWPLICAVLFQPLLLAPISLLIGLMSGTDRLSAAFSNGILISLIDEAANLALPSMFLSAALCVFAVWFGKLLQANGAAGSETSEEIVQQPKLREAIPTLPTRLGEDIVRVEAQDHYINVVTSSGQATLKMSFSDCVDRLQDFSGAQCHRSHWVSFRHIQDIHRSGSAYTCILSDGTSIPVSRRRRAALKVAV